MRGYHRVDRQQPERWRAIDQHDVPALIRPLERAVEPVRALFIFDEERGLLVQRMRSLGIDLEKLSQTGLLHIEQVDAAEMSPGEFTHRVRKVMQTPDMRTVVIDSHTRYVNVNHGETVTIKNGIHTINWYFDGIGTAFDLAKIMPAAAAKGQMVRVYVEPEPLG